MMGGRSKGVMWAVITMVISGVSIFVNKFAVGAIEPALVFTGAKNAVVGMLVVSVLIFMGKMKLVKKLKRDELFKLGVIGVIGGAVPFYLFFTGLSMIPAINAALIHKSLVLWVALLAIPLLREKLSLVQVGAIGLLVSSNLVIGGFGGFEFSVGELMILGATMLWAVENVVAKKTLKTVDADVMSAARMGLGSVILLVAAQIKYPGVVMGVLSMSGVQWMWMVVTAVALMGYVMSWYRALKLAPATLVATVLVGSTVITNVLSAVFITHKWTTQMGVQAIMIALGLGLFVWAARGVKITNEVRES